MNTMKIHHAALRLILAGAAIASLAACADTPQQPRGNVDYRSRPLDSPAPSNANTNPSGQRLTIQSGEGERLNLPWFIEGAQDWVNRQ
ncbi:hypothetical protein ASD71_18025 [Achromobacter sp. Root565]|nr:hypothetical protein [Achromobacter sp. Root565]KQZ98801.1 hypothetical protein ASD71_18025 [Achromobacter sp. Root565]